MAHPGAQPLTVVFVHGFLSSAETWSGFRALLQEDPDLTGVDMHGFKYTSPALQLRPDRQIPNVDDLADSLWTYLTHDLASRHRLMLVTHSQGGLVAQRMLARRLADGHGGALARIRRIVMFACPNSGSELMLLLRRRVFPLLRNPQERELRPLHEAVIETHRRVLTQIVHAHEVAPDRCPIRIAAYAGEQDGVVKPAVAKGVFPDTGVLPGDHFSVIRPGSREHRSYQALKRHLCEALATGDAPAAADVPAADPPPDPPRSGPGPGPQPRTEEIVDRLLDVPGMPEPGFRQQLYAQLPDALRQQLPRDSVVRVELVGVVDTFGRFPHLDPWDQLVGGLSALVPRHPAVTALRALLAELGLLDGDRASDTPTGGGNPPP